MDLQIIDLLNVKSINHDVNFREKIERMDIYNYSQEIKSINMHIYVKLSLKVSKTYFLLLLNPRFSAPLTWIQR